MYRLLEMTYDGIKETQAIREYKTQNTLEGNFEEKYGTNMENNSDALLIGLDDIGNALYTGKTGSHEFQPRLFDAKTTNKEVANLAKYDTVDICHARFHKKKGEAINDDASKQIVLRGFDGNGETLDYCHWVRAHVPVIE